jgi:hypothetical protein
MQAVEAAQIKIEQGKEDSSTKEKTRVLDWRQKRKSKKEVLNLYRERYKILIS